MTVELAFVGAGGIAQWQHFDTVEAMDDAEVVGICDVDEATAESAAERFDAPAFADHHDLYDETDPDAVFVCLPPFAHEDQEIAAAERGYDLFVEKPLALSAEKAREIDAAVEANDVLAQVGYDWRYSAGVERAREILGDRAIGYVDGYWWGGVAGGEDHWWRHAEYSGGQVVEQATHVYDTLRYLVGEVERVSAAGSHRIEDAVDFSDATSATMTHENGAISHVSTTCAAEDGKTGLEVVADGATLEVGERRVSGVVDGEEVEESFDRNPYRAEVETFVDAVATGDPAGLRSPYGDALETFELTLAVNESIDTGEPIALRE
ncbi:Gfo/Idh/MocA family protein [Halosimplex salinum]|uniref:Gfo/Idh/MocA family protein n=1 Tax=Halosimplex salinum TaxID=1710538 RepID=UPI000F495CA3|nr:Gfo/Idh/MocA family oxidoreductase [Halosimplex salinum]